jgi:hypothetical protein
MPSGKFTNVSYPRRTPEVSSGTSSGRPARRYLANQMNAKVMPLTPNEREARRQSKQHGQNRTAAFSIDPVSASDTVMSGTSSFFSPQLSTDFLELPQSIREKREIYRHFYNTDEIVAQSIDLHTELPLSKVRLATPKPSTCPKGFDSPEDYGKYILSFFQKMEKRVKLFQKLIMAVHHLWLDGTCAIFAEDSDVQIPSEIGYQEKLVSKSVVTEDGDAIEQHEKGYVEKDDREEEELAYYQKHYKGWDRLIIFPIDQVKISTFSFTDKTRVELIPSDRDRALIEQAKMGDPVAEEMAAEMPDEVREYIGNGRLIPLGTDPDEGSFVYLLSSRKQAGEELGQSILDRCLRTLYYREKLRQAQTQIASRAMTPKRIVWAEDISDADADNLREQVDLSLVDPDYSIVANYEIHWEEMGSKDRLLDLSGEYEQTERRLRTGLGVTESLLSGETLYSGDRLKLEVINQRYLFLREILQEYVEEYLFKPVARRRGFVEKDKWGEEVVLYPRLSFTRLPLRDSQDTYDALFNLYQKGSIPVDLILEMFNIDPDDTQTKIKRDMFTVNDAIFNEMTRAIYSSIGQKLADSSDVGEKLAKYLGLKMKEEAPAGGEDRFGG